jgi:hypothetical protein
VEFIRELLPAAQRFAVFANETDPSQNRTSRRSAMRLAALACRWRP